MRSDAARNADAILEAAREVVAAHGIGAPMALIAERAGVAVGTLYRHHPSKDDLVAAVVEDATRRLVGLLEDTLARIRAGEPVAPALEQTLAAVAEAYASDRAFKEHRGQALPHGPEADADDPVAMRGWRALDDLVATAHAAGALRADVGAADLVEIMAAAPADAARRATYLGVMTAGLRPIT